MADESRVTYVGKLLSNIIQLLPYDFDELKRLWGLEDELNQLQVSLDAIADLVEDAEQKQETVMAARRWLKNLKDVAYEADDVLSDLAYETTRLRIQNQEVHNFSAISRAIHNVRKAKFRLQMVHKLKKVNHLLQNIQRHSLSLRLTSIQRNSEDNMFENTLPAESIPDSPIVGRKVDVVKIVNLLTSSCYQKFTIVPIVGMSGVGKTALAKLVCHKVMALARKPFDVAIWVCVSDQFSEHKILGEMLKSLNPSKQGLINIDAILQQLKKELASKKLLLVLDDVWNQSSERWDMLRTLMSEICTNNGNGVLVTTRLETVASLMETSSLHSHKLDSLSNDECWFILKEMAFRNAITPIPSNLEAIGRDIANTCRGLPLVAKVLGGVMGFNRDEATWLKIRDVDIWKERQAADSLHILVESFHHFPSYLKPCFAFLSIFPKDFLIRKDELVSLWMAEGIVESCDMGNKCFDALLASSFLQDAEKDNDVILCKMHDIVHDLALYVSKSKLLIEIFSTIYHMYADDEFAPTSMDILKDKAKKLLSTIVPGAFNQEMWKVKRLRILRLNGADMEVLQSSVRKTKHMRYLNVSISETKEQLEPITKLYNIQTLNLSNSNIKELPEFITKLYNIRSLNLSNSNINELPESISKLHNLQTLNLSNSKIKELPESITEIYSLQTLKFLKCKELTKLPTKKINNLMGLKHISFSYEHQMPFGLGKLHGLETLLFFVVGPDRGGSIQELEYLNELSGDLEITRLEEVGDKEVERANLRGKAKIQGLGFQWSHGANGRSSRDEELVEGLQPHPNIKRLNIKYYTGEKWPSWMSRIKHRSDSDSFAVLNNLVDLRLERCCNCVQLPHLGDLPHLKFLKMNHLGKVKGIDNEFYGIDSEGSSIGHVILFPALKSLSISWMENLTDWSSPSDGNKVVFPLLENLSIQSCPKLTGFPMNDLLELVKLEITDCEELRLNKKQHSFAFLTSLSIIGCPKLTCLRNWLLCGMSFKEFSVRRCEWLTHIPENFGKVCYLTSLEIYCCKRLRYFQEEILCKLKQLQNLSVGAFAEELDDFHYLNRIKALPCLEELEIWGSDFLGREMCFLPNQLQPLIVLKSLKIMGFTAMEALPEWLTNLQSLRSLSLIYCNNLQCQSTATILQGLPSLTHLNVNCSPILEQSKSEWLQSLDTTKIKVEFSHSSKVKVR